jgi:hypothetical protein
VRVRAIDIFLVAAVFIALFAPAKVVISATVIVWMFILLSFAFRKG